MSRKGLDIVLNMDKLSYSIGQISELAEIAQSTLRYWETVFITLAPNKTAGGSRRYSKEDVEMILTIKNLLYDQGFTIKGANQFLSKQIKKDNPPQNIQNETVDSSKQNENRNTQGNQPGFKYFLGELIKIKNILER